MTNIKYINNKQCQLTAGNYLKIKINRSQQKIDCNKLEKKMAKQKKKGKTLASKFSQLSHFRTAKPPTI